MYLIVLLYLELIAKVARLVHVALVKVGMVWLTADALHVQHLIHIAKNVLAQVAQVVNMAIAL